MPRPSGGGASSRCSVVCPSPTPATSRTELVGPVGRTPISIPISRARGMRSSCRSSVAQRHTADSWISTGCPSCGRRRPATTTRSTRCGWASRRPAPRWPRASTRSCRRSPRPGTGWSRRRAQPDDVLARVHDPSTADLPGRGGRALAAGPVRRPGRPDAGGALPLPDAGDDRRPPHPARRGRPRRGRQLRLRHDDAGRPGHLGGGPRRGRLRPDRGRPGARRASARRTRCAGRPDTTRPRPGSAARATSTTPRSPPRRCVAAGTSGWR